MAGKSVVCAECNNEVSKRSTLFIEGKGRLCRSHTEVHQAETERKEDEKMMECLSNDSALMSKLLLEAHFASGTSIEDLITAKTVAINQSFAMGAMTEETQFYNLAVVELMKSIVNNPEVVDQLRKTWTTPEESRKVAIQMAKQMGIDPTILINTPVGDIT